MKKDDLSEDLYTYQHKWIPNNLKKGLGQFNVFHLEDFIGENIKSLSFSRRNYFKITLLFGKGRVYYAEKVRDIDKQALFFSTPQLPYSWEPLDHNQSGYFCVFTKSFFQEFGKIIDYPVFQSDENRIKNLDDKEAEDFQRIFQKMFSEINSDYAYKYDVLKNLVFEIIHTAMKLQSLNLSQHQTSNGPERLSSLFMELLERQFPIENINQKIELRLASEYANRLNVHTNHLNRALKETVQQTTTDIIANRIIKEAKILLMHTNWNISQIGFCLGFEETSNFSNFFKKHTDLSPSIFRKKSLV